MKCPNDGVKLAPAKRDGLEAEDAWGAHLRFWSARGFMEKLKALGDLRADGT
jgi:hypothetical protein